MRPGDVASHTTPTTDDPGEVGLAILPLGLAMNEDVFDFSVWQTKQHL